MRKRVKSRFIQLPTVQRVVPPVPGEPPTRPRRRLLGERNFCLSAFCGAMGLLIGVLGGSQNRRLTGALMPVGEPDSCSVARYSRKFSHVNYDGSFGTESGLSPVLIIC